MNNLKEILIVFVLENCKQSKIAETNTKQLHSMALGTHMAPSYTNIFMGKMEQGFLCTHEKLPLIWWIYIVNIFAVWTHGKPALQLFMNELNRFHGTIKLMAN